MSLDTRFSMENFLMSVAGHLTLVAIFVLSVAVVIDRAMLVAPDRIEIIEIDLNSVQVSGEETVLYNINEEPEPDVKEQEEEPKAEAVEPAKVEEPVQAEPVEAVEEVKEPTLVEPEKPIEQPEPEEQPKEEEPVKEEPVKEEPVKEEKTEPVKQEEPAVKAKKKRVVRVNREVVSLNRTLTVSVVDALRVAMTRCWVIDTARPDISDIRAVAHLTLRKNGTVRDVWFESEKRAETDPAFAYVLETIKSAIDVCQPFKMLPENEFEKWEKIQLTFYPTQGKVM